VQSQELLPKGEVLQDEFFSGAKDGDDPAEQMSKARKHQGIIAKSAPGRCASKSLILRTRVVLARHRDYPALNAVILNAGIMRTELLQSGGMADAEAIVATNLLGPIRLIAALLPMLLSRPRAAIMTVSSGLAFVPLAVTPTYCATKAAIHSYTQSLRYQLRHTSVEVLELVPPYVQTELLGPGQLTDPNALPLKDFISEAMHILKHSSEAAEICVERVKPLRHAEANGSYDTFFKTFNDRAASAHETL
jgi:uncharacterized oxidoreductase